MSKIIVQITGGLGNQMFQYACARALAIRTNSELLLDTYSGFIRDVEYKRKYELHRLQINEKKASYHHIFPFYLGKINKVFRGKTNASMNFIFGKVYTETMFKYSDNLNVAFDGGNVWLKGYWQSYRYFEDYSSLIARELMPPKPLLLRYRDLGNRLFSSDSVAVGVRFYEESGAPENHSKDGKLKSFKQIEEQVENLVSKLDNPNIFVFSTQKFLVEKLRLPSNVVYICPQNGFGDPLLTLFLLTQCRHHIFTNSTFYWWGAWLSKHFRGSEKQIIVAADNFINSDCLLPDWGRF